MVIITYSRLYCSILGKRDRTGEHEAMRKIKNEFMSMWDGLRTKEGERVLVLAATNRPFDLDDAVLRRLSRRLMVDLPDSDNRIKVMQVVSISCDDNINNHVLLLGPKQKTGSGGKVLLWWFFECI